MHSSSYHGESTVYLTTKLENSNSIYYKVYITVDQTLTSLCEHNKDSNNWLKDTCFWVLSVDRFWKGLGRYVVRANERYRRELSFT